MVWIIRGKTRPEAKKPRSTVSDLGLSTCVNFVLRHRKLNARLCIAILAATAFPVLQLGKEFMTPLNEGDIILMPTAVPGNGR